jgi:polyhydroxyalkanoate synthesis regulator phasin
VATEVKTKLTLDDEATRILEKIKSGFKGTDESRKEAQSGFAQFGRQLAATVIGVNFVPLMRKLSGLVTGVLDVARAADDAAQGFAGFLAGTMGKEWSVARSEAEGLHRSIVQMGVDIGQSSADISAGLKGLLTFMGGTQEAYQFGVGQLRNMTTIGNVMGMSVQQIAGGVGQMALGLVQTRSPLFGLIFATGIFGDNVRDVNKEWGKLTQAERIMKLEGAVGSIAEKLGKATPTFSDLVTSMSEAGKQFVETLGTPMLKALIPAIDSVRKELTGASGDFKDFAQDLGKDVGKWVRGAGQDIKEGFEYIRTHADEIKAAIVDGFTFAKDVVKFIIDNKEILAIAFGARLAAPVVGGAARVGAAAFRAGAGGAGMAGGAAGLTGAAGGIVGLGAFAVAIGGATLAAEQFSLLMGEMKAEDVKEAEARRAALEKMSKDFTKWDAEQAEHFRTVAESFVQGADVLNMSEEQARAFVQQLRDARITGESMVRQVEDAASRIGKLRSITGDVDAGDMAERIGEQADFIVNAFQGAISSGNKAQAEYIAGMLDKSEQLRDAFVKSGDLTTEGFEKMADMLKQGAEDFRNRLVAEVSEIAWVPGAVKGAKPKAPSISMSGGQVFKIQQDFRDQDPDRIAILFRRDIAGAATRRVQARTASPFGT